MFFLLSSPFLFFSLFFVVLLLALEVGRRVRLREIRDKHDVEPARFNIMDGAVWRDPERLQEWIGELKTAEPVVVFCAYGFHVGCKTAIALREAGFDAKYMKGGHSAWKAIGGPIKLYT